MAAHHPPDPGPGSRNRTPAGNDYIQRRNAEIGSAIREARLAAGLTQKRVVSAMRSLGATHWHPSTLNAIERGVQAVRGAELADLAQVLRVDVLELVSGPVSAELRELRHIVIRGQERREDLLQVLRDDEMARLRAEQLLGGLSPDEREDVAVGYATDFVNAVLPQWLMNVLQRVRDMHAAGLDAPGWPR